MRKHTRLNAGQIAAIKQNKDKQTPADLAKALDLPISTIRYHLKNMKVEQPLQQNNKKENFNDTIDHIAAEKAQMDIATFQEQINDFRFKREVSQNENYILLNFNAHAELFEKLKQSAGRDFRTIDQQILYFIDLMLNPVRFDVRHAQEGIQLCKNSES